MTYDSFDSRLTGIAERELMGGERLLWVGTPDPMGRAMSNLGPLVFGIIWLVFVGIIGFAVIGITSRTTVASAGRSGSGASGILSLIVLLLLLVGILMVLSPIYFYLKAKRTVYAVTDRRLLIISGPATSYNAADLEDIERRDGQGERGDVIFAHVQRRRRRRVRGAYGSVAVWDTYEMPVGFFGIDHARDVEALLLKTFFSGDNPPAGKSKRES